MAKKEKIQFIIDDADGKEICSFGSKTATAAFAKLAQGTAVRVSIDEGKDYGKQLIGDYVIKGLPNESIDDCPDGQHWDESKGQCVPDTVNPPPDHTCPQGQHWDEEKGQCVDDIPSPPPVTGNKINISAKWSNGNKRSFTGFDPDDDKVEIRADGNTPCVIDGQGNCTITGDRRRIYPHYNNYNAVKTWKLIPNWKGTGDDNSSHMRSRHNEKKKPSDPQSLADCSGDAFGGYGWSVSKNAWDSKREPEHNFHDQSKSGSLPKPIENDKPVMLRHTVKDEQDSGKTVVHQIGEIDYLDGKGFIKVMDIFDKSPEPWMIDRALYEQKSYTWCRNNGAGSCTVREMELEILP